MSVNETTSPDKPEQLVQIEAYDARLRQKVIDVFVVCPQNAEETSFENAFVKITLANKCFVIAPSPDSFHHKRLVLKEGEFHRAVDPADNYPRYGISY